VRRLPWWVPPLIRGVAVTVVVYGLSRWLNWERSLLSAALIGCAVGTVLSLLNARAQAREFEALRRNVGVLDRADLRRAEAVVAGEEPQSDSDREFAFRLATYRIAAGGLDDVVSRLSVVLVFAVSVVLSLAHSPWWWVAVAFGGLLVAVSVRDDRRLRSRAEELRAPLPQSSTRSFSPPE
jgi:hypothetical protein